MGREGAECRGGEVGSAIGPSIISSVIFPCWGLKPIGRARPSCKSNFLTSSWRQSTEQGQSGGSSFSKFVLRSLDMQIIRLWRKKEYKPLIPKNCV